jgi:O-antigen ligase
MAWWIVITVVVALPLTFDQQMKDTFREPKEIVFRAGAILLWVVLMFAWSAIGFRSNWKSLGNPVYLLSAAVLAWTALTAVTSQNRILSIHTGFTTACSVCFFLASRFAVMKRRTPIDVEIMLVAPVINAIVAILQEFKIWQPFRFVDYMAGHASTTAFLGNPNDVAVFLLLPAVVSIVGAVAFHGAHRLVFMAAGIVLLFGIVICGTKTVFIALAVAIVAMLLTLSRRAALVLILALLIATLPLLSASTKPGRQVRALIEAAKAGQYDVLLSERMPAYLTAYDMFRDHPIAGVGPGVYKYLYMPYRVLLPGRYPPSWTKGSPLNFREAHNDHLQILAETGVVGYLLFIACLVVLIIRRSAHNDDPSRFARNLRIPAVFAAGTVALAQFPLQLAAPRMVLLYLAAICVTWNE